MKKPEYLTGECKTFLEYLKETFGKDTNGGTGYEDLIKFYCQPFTKDMIVRPKILVDHDHYPNLGQEVDDPDWQPLFKGEWVWLNRHYVDYKTPDGKGQVLVSILGSIDDFIREAKKAGIKIEWNDR